MGANPLQMVSMISPSGVLYQGTKGGLLRVEALVPATSTATLALGGIAWAAWSRRTRWRHFLQRVVPGVMSPGRADR